MTKLVLLGQWILFNCKLHSRLTCIVMSVCCQFADGVADQPRQLPGGRCSCAHMNMCVIARRSMSRLTYRRSILREEGPVCWAAGRLCETWLQSLCQTSWLAQQRDLSRFSSGGRPNIRTCHPRLPVRVAHRQLRPARSFTPRTYRVVCSRQTIRMQFRARSITLRRAVLTARG